MFPLIFLYLTINNKNMSKEELLNLFFENEDMIDWERYDFVDPPYCWAVTFAFEVDGYTFFGDGDEVCGEDEELKELWVETPDGENICLIERR